MRRLFLLLLAGLGLVTLVPQSAKADVDFGVTVGGPVYYDAYPVYYGPYYRPGYYRYYHRRPYYYYHPYHYGYWHRYHRWHH
ncbi:MAG: hypothetical protein JO069_06975 [Verrucomicrobia bacterium]|nr:hypothetical protein [Verrucomicrobiota bacterium]